MEKVKYYQIAFKGMFPEQEYIKLVSPKRSKVDSLIANGYTARGYKLASSIPNDPILDGTTIREKTNDEKQALIDYKKSLIVIFNMRDIQTACDDIDLENGNTELNDKLNEIMSNPRFARHLIGASGMVDLTDSTTEEALTLFAENEINTIKLKIVETL